MRYLLWGVVLLSLIMTVQAQVPVQERGLVMVRCDTGDGTELLDSPAKINLDNLHNSFKPNLDTVVFIHGFNNSFSSAQTSYTNTMNIMRPILGEKNYVGFYWPSDMMVFFGTAVDHANKSGPHLIHVLSNITNWYGGSGGRIHLISHSLGGRVLLSTLKHNDARYVRWGKCFGMASAVHSNVYMKSFAGANNPPLHTQVYYSKNDWVLKYLYSMYYWLFEREGVSETPQFQTWQKMTIEQKLDYMHNLDLKAAKGVMPDNAFDWSLYNSIQRAEQEAMGLIGADVGNPKSIHKVENVDVSNDVDGHSYWGNRTVAEKIANAIR